MENERIIKLASSCDGMVFGGYLRDVISGETPKDMDIWFRSNTDIQQFIIDMAMLCSIRLEKVENTEYGYGSFIHYRLYCDYMSLEHIDLVVRGEWHNLDVDVNMLYLFRGELRAYHGDILDILANIGKKQFKRLPHCTNNRQAKMVAKGWTEV